MTKKYNLKSLLRWYQMSHNLHTTKTPLLLEGGGTKVRTISPSPKGRPLDSGTVNPYLHQLLSGEIDVVTFKGYGEEELTLRINLINHKVMDYPKDKIYYIQSSIGMRMSQVFQITGIPVTQFVLQVNKYL